jgi:probable phosphoglycerate mutase
MSEADRSCATLLLLRHGPTAWNAEGRIQGRSDTPLSSDGEAVVGAWRLPPEVDQARWYVSPLLRARHTAALLGHDEALVEPCLIEADWGAWEGECLGDLRARLGAELGENEARGLDFRPPGGESPRDLQRRVAPFLRRLSAAGGPAVAVTHKGIIRAVYALASGWDMRGGPSVKLKDQHAHLFTLAPDGAPQIGRLNLPLTAEAARDA